MLNTEHMQKVRIVCLYKDKQAVTAALHKLGSIDLRKSRLELTEDVHPSYFNDLSDMLIKVDGALKLLHQRPITPEKHKDLEDLIKAMKLVGGALDSAYSLDSERRMIYEDDKLLDYADYVAKSFAGLDINFGSLHSDFLNFKAFETDEKTVSSFQKGVDETGIDVEIITNALLKGRELLFITYPREVNMDNLLKRFRMNELDLNSNYLSDVPRAVIKSISEKRQHNKQSLDKISKELEELSRKYYSRFANLREMLDIEVARAEASGMFKRTEKSLVIEGWVPKKSVDHVHEALRSATKGKFHMGEVEPDELAPTLVRRAKILRPFDYLMEFFSVPRSDEVDPTWIFIIFFPVFYGLMISDAGYGIASFLFATWITTRTDPDGLMYNVAKIWRFSAISAIFFGVLSNQYFGMGLNQYFIGKVGLTPLISYIGFDWLKDITTIIIISIAFGLAQVGIGLLFGFVNNYRKKNYKLAISKLTSISILAFGCIAIGGGLFHLFNANISLVAAGIAVASVIATAVLSGEEAIEIISLIGHPLSYARIMGFGLASVIIALLIDKAFTPSLSQGIALFIVYTVIFILFHVLNMILSIFEGIIQGVRLNFVEFFSKFYTGGGVKFKPFHYKRRYTHS